MQRGPGSSSPCLLNKDTYRRKHGSHDQPAYLPCRVKRKTRPRRKSRNGTILKYHATFPGRVYLSEKPDRCATHADCTPEVDLQLRAGVGIGCALDFAEQAVPGIVEHDVESSKHFLDACKCGGDIGRTSDVEGEEKKLGGRVLFGEVEENRGPAEGGDDDIAFAEEDLSEGLSEPGRRAGDCCNA